MRKKIFYFFLFIFLIISDQLTKYFSQNFTSVTINDGASFGLIKGFGGEIYVQLILLLIILFVLQKTTMSVVLKVLFLAGVLSNTIDRLLLGGVQDWLPIPFFDLKNNFADWYIFIAIAIYVLKYGYEYRNNLRR